VLVKLQWKLGRQKFENNCAGRKMSVKCKMLYLKKIGLTKILQTKIGKIILEKNVG
jgi:hypothetical protein